MKYLLVLLVVGVGLWLLLGRQRRPPAGKGRPRAGEPDVMQRCAHCGVHLPAADAVSDAAGRAFCSDAHRLAGPR